MQFVSKVVPLRNHLFLLSQKLIGLDHDDAEGLRFPYIVFDRLLADFYRDRLLSERMRGQLKLSLVWLELVPCFSYERVNYLVV